MKLRAVGRLDIGESVRTVSDEGEAPLSCREAVGHSEAQLLVLREGEDACVIEAPGARAQIAAQRPLIKAVLAVGKQGNGEVSPKALALVDICARKALLGQKCRRLHDRQRHDHVLANQKVGQLIGRLVRDMSQPGVGPRVAAIEDHDLVTRVQDDVARRRRGLYGPR